MSDDPWGWATDHYGRWFYDPDYGWVWVPGYEWAPAWVDWVVYDGWIGWAPLPPSATWSVNVGFAPRYSVAYDRYVFVEPRYLGSTSWQRHAAPRERSARFARDARRVTRYQPSGGRIVNRSLTYAPSTPVRIVDVESPRALRRAIDRGRLTVFRPQVARNARLVPPRRSEPHRALSQPERRTQVVPMRSPGVETKRQAVRPARVPPPERIEHLRPQERRTVVKPAPRRAPAVKQRLERSRRPAVAPSRTHRPTRQVTQTPRRPDPPQVKPGRGRGRGDDSPAHSGGRKKTKGSHGRL